uniref:VP2 n=1 Tax=Bat calicivirus BtCalV/M63/HUN/2013 TaxID=1511638 RepID=A0A1B1XXT8_9CALI|nr:VP2 [Bat calicivirus BtCalV/M63/HUN/2013]
MGSWTTGVLGSLGLAGDLATSVGSLVLGAQANQVNQDLAQLQAQALTLNLQLQKEALQQQKDWNDPGVRYKMAIDAGYDPISARQVAGAGFLHLSGGVAMQPIKAVDGIHLRHSNMAQAGLESGRAFTAGVGRATRPTDFYNSAFVHQQGQDVFLGGDWRPPSSSWAGRSASLRSNSTVSTWASVPPIGGVSLLAPLCPQYHLGQQPVWFQPHRAAFG